MKIKEIHRAGELYGWLFLCPGCGHGHMPVPGRWQFNGDKEKPTFSPSILCTYPRFDGKPEYCCHSFVRNGEIQFLNDCTHELAGRTVPLPDFEHDEGGND